MNPVFRKDKIVKFAPYMCVCGGCTLILNETCL